PWPRPAPEDASLESLALRVQLASFPGPALPADIAELLAAGLGGICLFASNVAGSGAAGVAGLTAAVRAANPWALVAVDEEGGDVTRLHVAEHSPVLGAAALGAADDLALTTATGRAVGADLAAAGIDIDLGPVADVNCDPDNPVIGTRSFGADQGLVARHVAAWLTGLQERGVAACVKHFPGHGDTAQDSHLTLPVVTASEQTLRARELVPFAAAIAAGTAAVMTSHLVVPAVEPDVPATFSPRLLRTLLRDELGFTGVVISDALDMAGACAGRGIPEAAVQALAAGVDLVLTGANKDAALVRAVQAAIVAAVRAGRLPRERLVDAATRVASVRRPVPPDGAAPGGDPALPDTATVRRAARAALVIEGTLPDLTGARVASVATEPNIAVGVGPWGVAPDLLVPPGDPLPPGPLVVQVRDAHRWPLVQATLATLRGPAVVVEWGWPGPRGGEPGARSAARICTWGSSRPMIGAVEEIMREAGWRR
ncbi:MAG: glycoside hydrolase family 3 protein, partial [Frankia sp.]|nr:glycoside hydrolase family 3 protein [Frankia sp.]